MDMGGNWERMICPGRGLGWGVKSQGICCIQSVNPFKSLRCQVISVGLIPQNMQTDCALCKLMHATMWCKHHVSPPVCIDKEKTGWLADCKLHCQARRTDHPQIIQKLQSAHSRPQTCGIQQIQFQEPPRQGMQASPLMQAVQSAVCVDLLHSEADAVLAAGLRDHDDIHVGIAYSAEEGAGCSWDPHHPRALQKQKISSQLQYDAWSMPQQQHWPLLTLL